MKQGQILPGKTHVCGQVSSCTKAVVRYYSGTEPMRKYFIILLKSCWQYANSLLQASQLMMLPHLSFTSPPSTAARSAISLCPVITSYSSFWGKGEGREWNHSTLPKGAASLKVNRTSAQDGSSCVQDAPISATAQYPTFYRSEAASSSQGVYSTSIVLPGQSMLSDICSLPPLGKCNWLKISLWQTSNLPDHSCTGCHYKPYRTSFQGF